MLNRDAVNGRIFLVLGVLLYISAFLFSYEQWVVPRYAAWGMAYREVPFIYLGISWVLCLIPALWLPRNLTRPSQLLFYLQYLVIFIPASFIVYYSSRPELTFGAGLDIVLTLFSGLCILQLFYALPLLQFKQLNISKSVFWWVFSGFAFFLFLFLLKTFGGYFQLAGFQGIYQVRAIASKIIEESGSSFPQYAQTWLAGFILPFIFSVGLFCRRRILVALAVIGYLYLFGIGGSKSTMLGIVYLSGIFFLMRRGGVNAPAKTALCFAALLLFPAALSLLFNPTGSVATWFIAVIHSRIFCIPQLSIAQYYDFFQNHPLTLGSHVTGINLLIHYPYDIDVPRTVGRYFYHAEVTANVNMWAQDGIASFGLLGVPVISLIAGVTFWIFDSVASFHDRRLVTVALGNIALSFANISLFTTIVSGGLLWLAIALYLYCKEC